jgi:N-acyl homoserine lactone hydrolase
MPSRVLLTAAAAVLTLTACVTLPAAPPHASVLPAPHPPPMQVCWLEFARAELPATYALAGGSERDLWRVTFSGLLVRHPKGDLLIDTGNGPDFAEHIATARFGPRLLLGLIQGGNQIVQTATAALRGVGEPPLALSGIVLSHIHGDHAGGLVELPLVPVLASQEEVDFAAREKDTGGFHVVKAFAEVLAQRARPLRFIGGPYENFDVSLDYFGDGSVVFVPLSGHTPGSLGTFINRTPGERLFHVGDAVNTTEAIDKRRGKSIVLEPTDVDSTRAEAVVSGLTQLHGQDPLVRFLPAHDRDAWVRAFGAPGRCLGEPLRFPVDAPPAPPRPATP